MQVNFVTKWEPKGPSSPKIDEESRLLLYQERVANKVRSFSSSESIFEPRNKFAQ